MWKKVMYTIAAVALLLGGTAAHADNREFMTLDSSVVSLAQQEVDRVRCARNDAEAQKNLQWVNKKANELFESKQFNETRAIVRAKIKILHKVLGYPKECLLETEVLDTACETSTYYVLTVIISRQKKNSISTENLILDSMVDGSIDSWKTWTEKGPREITSRYHPGTEQWVAVLAED